MVHSTTEARGGDGGGGGHFLSALKHVVVPVTLERQDRVDRGGTKRSEPKQYRAGRGCVFGV